MGQLDKRFLANSDLFIVEGILLNETNFTKYYENGKIEYISSIKNGESIGHYKEYFENGQLNFETNFIDGINIENNKKASIFIGKFKQYWSNGHIGEEYFIDLNI